MYRVSPKRRLLLLIAWPAIGLFLALGLGCGGGGGTTTDLATVPTSLTSSGGSSSDIAALISAAVGKAPTFTFATPTFDPTSGGAGLRVIITATAGTGTSTNLSSVTLVDFAGAAGTSVFSHPSSTSLTVLVPQGAKNGLISLRGGANTAAGTSTTTFEVEPVVTGVSDPNIVPGRSVTIVGRNFCVASAVTFNTTTVTLDQPVAECTGTDPTQTKNTKLTVTLPASVVLPLLVSVTTPSGSGTASSSMTISAVSKNPTISAVTPSNGGAGMLVSIIGLNFMGGGSLASVELVSFAGVAPITSGFTVVSDTLLTSVQIPAGARNGLVLVSVANKNVGQSANLYSVEPIVRSVTPNIARAGVTTLTVLGSNFCGASLVSFNASSAAVTSANTCSGFNNLQAANTTVTAVLPAGVTGPVSLISVLTPNGTGFSLLAPTPTSSGRVALLTSFNPALQANAGGAVYPLRAGAMIQAGNVIVLGSQNALISMSLAGAFLGSMLGNFGLSAPFEMATVTGSITSVYLTSIPTSQGTPTGLVSTSTVYGWGVGVGGPAELVSRTSIPASSGIEGPSPTVGPLAITPVGAGANGMLYVGDWGGYLGSLMSAVPSVAAVGPSLVSFSAASFNTGVSGNLGQIVGMKFGLTSVWALTSLGSVYVIENASGGTSGPARLFAPFTASRPSQIAFGLNSVWIAGGDAIGILSSTGAAWPSALLASFNLNTLAAWGSGTPLVSALAFDGAPGTAGANLWYLDTGQNALVRCAAGQCATGLTSFAFAGLGFYTGTGSNMAAARNLLVDSLGSLWLANQNAVERFIP